MNKIYVTNGYDTVTFGDVYPDLETFLSNIKIIPQMVVLNDNMLTILYYLLCSRYMGSHIKSNNLDQFNLKMISTIYTNAPIWERKLEIQKAIIDLGLDNEEIIKGTKAIYNHAYNDGGSPGTGTLKEIDTLDSQSTSNFVKSKLDAYYNYYQTIENEITNKFIKKFETLFIQIIGPYCTLGLERED